MRRSLCPSLLFGLLLSLPLLLSGGCGPKGGAPILYAYVIDYSGSTAALREREIGAVLAGVEEAPEGSWATAYRMGRTTDEIFDGPVDESAEDALASAAKKAAGTSDPREGTSFRRMAEALAALTRRANGRRLRVLVLTDGGDDFASDPSEARGYRAAAGELARCPELESLEFWGVEPGSREAIRAAFGAAGPKLRILGRDELPD